MVFVRYVTGAWRRLVSQKRDRIAGVVYFMDDDLLDLAATRGLPVRYRWKLARLATRHRRWLAEVGAEFWVSSPSLAEKYAGLSPRLILPKPLPSEAVYRRVFYHGTASHGREIQWLRGVVERLVEEVPDVHFELVGDARVASLYRGLPGVTVCHPMKWPAFRAFQLASRREVGLAPQFDTPFNRSRSYTKFFDITAAGAVGIYTRGSAAGDLVENCGAGLVLPMETDLWVEAIRTLLADDAMRLSMLNNAHAKINEISSGR